MEKVDDIQGGGNALDFGARIYDSRLGRWLSLDPMQNKYPSLCPYNFVANNPIIYVDPNGKEIKPADNNTLEVIKSTLPEDARQYVVIDPATGFIDKTRLMQYQNEGGSSNFSTLLSLVKSNEVIPVSVTSGQYEIRPIVLNNTAIEDYINLGEITQMTEEEKITGLNGDPDYNISTGEGGDLGLTVPKDLSKSGNFEVLVNSNLSKAGQAEVMAHELYGHLPLNLEGKDAEHKIVNGDDTNDVLEDKIIQSVKEAKNNYEQK